MTILEVFLITCIIISIAYYVFSLYCTTSFFNKKCDADDNYLPPVTILKPINGVENGIYENLISYCKQDYPSYQVIFGVSNRKDHAIDVVKKVMNAFPQKDIELVINNDGIGPNPKISNLNNMYKKAKNDIIVMSDSDTRVNGDYLRKLVSPLSNENTGLVTCAYREKITNNITSMMESVSINHDFIPSIMVAQKVENLSYAFGVTIATKREILDDIGGFKEFANYLAEDFHFGKKISDAGYKLYLSDYIVDVIPEKKSFTNFFKHQLRWAKTIKACRPIGYISASFCKYGIVTSLVYLLISSFSTIAVILFITFLSVRIISASIISFKYIKGQRSTLHLLLLPISDILSFTIWCASFSGNRITWRGMKFLLKKGGKIERI
ncbi:MAG: ceramide glucosyltransferase [Candidatus Scalindua rubra]|uniref:Ceramide glucosyltransferase n=1 Tax=Candidatus Scalindua rubra TaxID=1872076 RepID=A0A1E3X7I3_9BACT|nr:MAG: ceramide glucosyltransferase [Candidatus Scalindua rubra]